MRKFMARRYEKYGYFPVGLIPNLKFLFNRVIRKILNTFGMKYTGFDLFVKPFKLNNNIFYNIIGGHYFKISDSIDFNFILCGHERFQDKYIYETLREGSTFIDVGAHIGRFTLPAASLVGEKGLVVALEPDQRVFKRLMENIEINKLQNVISLPLAAFNNNTLINFKISNTSGWSSLIDMHKEAIFNEVHIPAFKLDTIIESLGLERVDLVKIDVEGAEDYVLEGSIEILNSLRPALLIEVHDKEAWIKCRKILENYGYEYNIIHRNPTKPNLHFHIYANCAQARRE